MKFELNKEYRTYNKKSIIVCFLLIFTLNFILIFICAYKSVHFIILSDLTKKIYFNNLTENSI